MNDGERVEEKLRTVSPIEARVAKFWISILLSLSSLWVLYELVKLTW